VSIPVVYDINVLVDAVALADGDFGPWPTLPPTTQNPAADCIGIVNNADNFGLWLSPHICENTIRVLRELGQPADGAELYLEVLADIAEPSGGGLVEPPHTVSDGPDWEDNQILDLVVYVGAMLLVTSDQELLAMNPWRGRPIITPREFASREDSRRRAARSRKQRR
jgi:predicted nucleic acid-binding protein